MSNNTKYLPNTQEKIFAILSNISFLWIVPLLFEQKPSTYLRSHMRIGMYCSLVEMFLSVPFLSFIHGNAWGSYILALPILITRIAGIVLAFTNSNYNFPFPIITFYLDKLLRKMASI